MFLYTFWHFFVVVVVVVVVFHQRICVFMIFITFVDQISNLAQRILKNQKQGLVV